MSTPEILSSLRLQLAKGCGNRSRKAILCKSPLSASLSQAIFKQIVHYCGGLFWADGSHADLVDKTVETPVLVRLIIHSLWKSGNDAFRQELERNVKRYSANWAMNSSLEGSFSVGAEVAEQVWQSVVYTLNDLELLGMEKASYESEYNSSPRPNTLHLDDPTYNPMKTFIKDSVDLTGIINPQSDRQTNLHQVLDRNMIQGVYRLYRRTGVTCQRIDTINGLAQAETKDIPINGGAFFMDKYFCWVGDGPIKVILDDSNRPHNPNGPALEYADGWRVYALDGIRVNSAPFEQQHDALDILGEPNPLIQRIMIRKYGESRFLETLDASIVQSDDYGKLWKTKDPIKFMHKLPAGRASRIHAEMLGVGHYHDYAGFAFVEVLNSTPESDGNFRNHFLRVPFNMSTAREAVAWTFDMNSSEYEPTHET